MSPTKPPSTPATVGDLFEAAGVEVPSLPRIAGRTKTDATNAAAALIARRHDSQLLAFTPRDFILCCLPLQQPAERVLDATGQPVIAEERATAGGKVKRAYQRKLSTSWIRRNGSAELRLTTDQPDVGLPFGEDLLTLCWLVTAFNAAGCPEDNRLRFRSSADVLTAFNLQHSGSAFRRLRDSLARLMAVTVRVTMHTDDPRQLKTSRYNLIRTLDAFVGHPNQHALWQNVVELDHHFAQDLREHRVPIDWHSLLALSAASRHLYVWEAWRSYRVHSEGRKEVNISLFKPGGLWDQLGSEAESPGKRKQSIRKWHAEVLRVWPECPNRLTKDAEQLIVRPAQAVSENAKLILPGISRTPPVALLSEEARAAMKPTLRLRRLPSND
ncbi:replication protein RepA [Corallococcus sp. AB038B]|uniref:replication protein RepA n=1 Tax=Corallococcus sp. AB038B TaxID=2316718 RepID=UPI000EE85CA9|nr:replication protein RepA [Corallococcus sp. AB038B]RKH92984.1 hypothetical protein D7Y04_41930 [Corallococcus sp. AB038B]